MKVIYVAGAYSDPRGPWYIKQNIDAAEAVALELWRMGAAVICPHKNTAFFDGADGTSRDTWILGDMAILQRCDAIYMMDGWERSEGATDELKMARDIGLPVLMNMDEAKDYLA